MGSQHRCGFPLIFPTQFIYMWVPMPKRGNPAVTSYKLIPEHEFAQQEGFFITKVTSLFQITNPFELCSNAS